MERSRSEWMACNGMPEDVCERTRIKYQQLQETLGVKAKVPEATDNVRINTLSLAIKMSYI